MYGSQLPFDWQAGIKHVKHDSVLLSLVGPSLT